MESEKAFCKMEYGIDEQGQEVLLKEGKFQVMMEWEKPYMHACIDALRPTGHVLEIGFGLGYSAQRIQDYRPAHHTIIEYHPQVAQRARKWAQQYPHVTIIEDTWQHALPTLGIFDTIFFDDYPLENEQQMQVMQEQSIQSQSLLTSGKQLLEEVHRTLPFLETVHYQDADLQAFMHMLDGRSQEEKRQAIRFFKELAERNQISSKQRDQCVKQWVDRGDFTAAEVADLLGNAPASASAGHREGRERFYQFFEQCLDRHMKVGSRFSCFLSSAQSKHQDLLFSNQIIANPWVDFYEQELTIDVPSHCHYFSGNRALVIVITKQGPV